MFNVGACHGLFHFIGILVNRVRKIFFPVLPHCRLQITITYSLTAAI